MNTKKILRTAYYVLLGALLVLAGLIIFSTFPISGNYKLFLVESGSMEPKIKIGSVAVVKPQAEYEAGDIISFRSSLRENAPTTHRIYDIREVDGETRFITKGDANNAPDRREVRESEVIGKMLFSVPFVGYAVSAAQKPLGFVLIIVIPATMIIFDEARNIWEEIKKLRKEDKKDDLIDKKQGEEIRTLREKVKKLEEKK